MESKLKYQLLKRKVLKMKNPTILLNKTDFENFKKEEEIKVNNLKIGEDPTFEGIPIKIDNYIKQGTIIIYDNIPPLF